MQNQYQIKILSVSMLILLLNACSGLGQNQAPLGSNIRPNPASIANGNSNLQNANYEALTIAGDLHADNLTIINSLTVESSLFISNSQIKATTLVGKALITTNSKFTGAIQIGGDIQSDGSYFASSVIFAGNNGEFTKRSKIKGNLTVISTKPTNIILNRSVINGNIEFKNSKGIVTLTNHAHLKGKVINGQLQNK